jgi:3-phenylpropionate/trans-cinnamate dioxygenase ferredoxin reductase component
MAPDSRGVVIVGGGQAGHQVAVSLREEGFDGSIRIFGEEPYAPYQRPPLSKELLDQSAASDLALASLDELAANEIELATRVRVQSIERLERRILLDDRHSVSYGHLVIATGARNRGLRIETPESVCSVRGLNDAAALKESLNAAARLVVIGGGFLGLEIAAMANAKGIEVDVVEATAVPMGRAVSPATSMALVRHHQAKGIRFHLRRSVTAFETRGRRLSAVRLDDDRIMRTDAALISVGVSPNDELAAAAGLPTANGILVNAELRTSDPAIFAIGDCAAFPSCHAGGITRFESVQNAVDQGRHLAACLIGRRSSYECLPWFWSEQGGMKLQIAGLAINHDDAVTIGDMRSGGLSTFCFRSGILVGIETINRPADHMAARRSLASARTPTRDLLDDREFDLRTWLIAK